MKSEKQSAAARENGKRGGRPKTGQTERTLISLPSDFVRKIDAAAGSSRFRVRWMMERLAPFLEEH